MPKITFLPSNLTFEARAGETLLDVALAHGVPIQHACGGFCACTTCHCEVLNLSEGALIAPDSDERERLEVLDDATPRSRLACQTKVMGDVTVRVVNPDL